MAELLHASAVAVADRAVLIQGRSGCGKSGLALDLLSRGATLIADDRVILTPSGDGPPLAAAPDGLRGRIEARFLGLLRTDSRSGVPVALVVDLDREAGARLPPPRTIELLGHEVPLLWAKGAPNLAAAILIALKGGLEAHD